ncbi:hypothetical protein ACSQ67_016713 [Phaseolus vulgaris]
MIAGKSYPPITEEECMGRTVVTEFDLRWVSGARTEGNKQKEECNASPKGFGRGTHRVESNLVTKKREDLAKDDKAAPKGPEKGDDAKGGTTTDSEVTHIPEPTSSPPRR